MNSCYSFKEYLFNEPIFKNIDATYIIHLENNGRLSSIENQLSSFHPTQKVYILFNKGYKNCKKKDFINTTGKDLVDAFFTIFKDSRKKGYNNILILEDDFQFNNKISEEKKHAINIDIFLQENNNNKFVYYLGILPWIQYDLFYTNPNIILGLGTHACIYSKKCIDYFLDKVNQPDIKDWDFILNFSNIKRNKYYMPLCYQTFPETENSANWHQGSQIFLFVTFFVKSVNKLLGLDVVVEPGYTIMEYVSRILFWIILFLIIFKIYKLILYLKIKYKTK
jgi:hypothetical protein